MNDWNHEKPIDVSSKHFEAARLPEYTYAIEVWKGPILDGRQPGNVWYENRDEREAHRQTECWNVTLYEVVSPLIRNEMRTLRGFATKEQADECALYIRLHNAKALGHIISYEVE